MSRRESRLCAGARTAGGTRSPRNFAAEIDANNPRKPWNATRKGTFSLMGGASMAPGFGIVRAQLCDDRSHPWFPLRGVLPNEQEEIRHDSVYRHDKPSFRSNGDSRAFA